MVLIQQISTLILALMFTALAIYFFILIVDPTRDPNKIPKNLLLGVFSSFIAVVLIYFATFGYSSLSVTPEGFGSFGDYVGGVLNPVVAFAALYALWKTLDAQKEANEKAEGYLKTQLQKDEDKHHDMMFIELMQQYRTVLTDLKFENFEGKQVLEQINACNDLMSSILIAKLPDDLSNLDTLACCLYFPSFDEEGLKRDVPQKLSELNPYFRMVYHVLKYQSNIKRTLKFKNTKYFRAQLTEDELVLIAVNAMFNPEGIQGLQRLLNEFALLKHMKHKNLRILASHLIGENCLLNEEEENYVFS